jgi:hypothetical protein
VLVHNNDLLRLSRLLWFLVNLGSGRFVVRTRHDGGLRADGTHVDPIRLQHALAFGFDGIGPLHQPATFATGLEDQGRGFGNVNAVGLAQALAPRGRVDRVAKDLESVLSN